MVQDVISYFKSGFQQLRCAPKLIIPFLISEALFYALGWTVIFILVLFSLPVLSKVIPVLERNQDIISEIFKENGAGNYTDMQIQGLEKEFSDLFPDMMYFLIIFSVLLGLIIIISFILYAWVQAGTIGYLWQGITASVDFKNFRYHARKNLYRVAGLWILIILFSIILFFVPFSALIIIPSPANILLFFLLILVVFVLWIIVMLLVFFAEECIIIENKSVVGAIKRSKEIVAENKVHALVFVIIFIGTIGTYMAVFGLFELIANVFNSTLSPFFELLLLLLVSPWIQLAKLNFFLDRTGRAVRVMGKEIEIIRSVREFIVRSPHILVDFTGKNLRYVLAALYFCVAGFGIGYYIGYSLSFLSDEFMELMKEFTENRLLGPYFSLPFIDMIDYFSNNAMVVINQGLSGLFFVIPAILGIIVTGIIIGLLYGALSAKIASAFLVAHGVIEVTGFVVATAAGIKLGVGFIKGSEYENELLDETLKVVLAVLLLIGIASFIEAFITPVLISFLI